MKIRVFVQKMLDQMGVRSWYRDCCAGQVIEVRQATQEDLDRCILGDGPKDPALYWVEVCERGSLIQKAHCIILEAVERETVDIVKTNESYGYKCPKCQTSVQASYNYCIECGSKINWIREETRTNEAA